MNFTVSNFFYLCLLTYIVQVYVLLDIFFFFHFFFLFLFPFSYKIPSAFFLIFNYALIRGSLDKFPDFFHIGTFIDSTHMKL